MPRMAKFGRCITFTAKQRPVRRWRTRKTSAKAPPPKRLSCTASRKSIQACGSTGCARTPPASPKGSGMGDVAAALRKARGLGTSGEAIEDGSVTRRARTTSCGACRPTVALRSRRTLTTCKGRCGAACGLASPAAWSSHGASPQSRCAGRDTLGFRVRSEGPVWGGGRETMGSFNPGSVCMRLLLEGATFSLSPPALNKDGIERSKSCFVRTVWLNIALGSCIAAMLETKVRGGGAPVAVRVERNKDAGGRTGLGPLVCEAAIRGEMMPRAFGEATAVVA
mmetsp:Transcript_114295/g.330156  ORF Transcript_114295/g.330156 Transcript_114295/m.330156 type:complete len:281 (-) Transcript_114295:336-1178(-)